MCVRGYYGMMLLGKLKPLLRIIDYVNRIGNCSCELYICINDGRALHVMRPMALFCSMCSDIEGVASKQQQIETSGIKEQ